MPNQKLKKLIEGSKYSRGHGIYALKAEQRMNGQLHAKNCFDALETICGLLGTD